MRMPKLRWSLAAGLVLVVAAGVFVLRPRPTRFNSEQSDAASGPKWSLPRSGIALMPHTLGSVEKRLRR